MSLLLEKIKLGKIHIAELNQWRRDKHPELTIDRLFSSLEQLKKLNKIRETHDPKAGSYYEAV